LLKFTAKSPRRYQKSDHRAVIAHAADTDEFAVVKGVKNLPRMSEIISGIWIVNDDVAEPRAQYNADFHPKEIVIKQRI